MAGTSETARYDLAIVATYVYGHDALLKIEDDGSNRTQRFTLDVPELDLVELERELDSPQGLALASAKAFLATTTFVSKIIRGMRTQGESVWEKPVECSPEFWAAGRKAYAEKQAQREKARR